MFWCYCSYPHHGPTPACCHCVSIYSKPHGQSGSHHSGAQAETATVWQPISKQGIKTWATSCSFSSPSVATCNSLYKKSINSTASQKTDPPIPKGIKMEWQLKHHLSIGGYRWLFNCYSIFMGIKGDRATHFIMGLPTQNVCLGRKITQQMHMSEVASDDR